MASADKVPMLAEGHRKLSEQVRQLKTVERPEVVQAIERLQLDPDERLRRRARKLIAHYRRGGRINVL